jgi:ubiquinone/menaquinone biosynthesis C-methylase UbiE
MSGDRKQEEIELQNKIRSKKLSEDCAEFRRLTANRKFYSITRKGNNFLNDYFLKNYVDKKILDYGCGDGDTAVSLVKKGVEVVGIDIADIRIKKCKELAKKEGVSNRASFFVMDAEKTTFPDNYFDGIICSGVLHHLDTKKAFGELARILKSEGSVICNEPLAYNPVFQLYRKMTPYLRSEWEAEHILSKKDFRLVEKYFGKVEKKFFYLFSLLAVPFRNTFLFKPILLFFEKIDSVTLSFPGLRWWAWQVIFILSNPKK